MKEFKCNACVIMLIVFGILNLIYYILLNSRGITFAPFFFVFSMILIFLGIIKYIKPDVLIYFKTSIAFKLLIYIFILFFLSFLIIESMIIYWSYKKESVKADYIIILGAGVRGTTPSLTLYERLNTGIKCINRNPDASIILSGGKGTDEEISEAEAMRRYLITHGIDEKRIILEDKSRNTEQNIMYSKRKIEEKEDSRSVKVLLVTSNFHMFRASFLARKAGIHVFCYSAPIPAWLVPTYYIREYFAVFKSYI